MNEQYIEDLYCIKDALEKSVSDYAQKVKKAGKIADEASLKWGDMLTHFAKNLDKEICFAEGMSEEEAERFSGSRGGTQGYGRAIRTTPGMESGYGYMPASERSMRGSYNGSYEGRGYSSRRDSMGRYASGGGSYNDGYSGHDDQEGTIAKLRKMADMTTNHDEREIILNMIERLRNEG